MKNIPPNFEAFYKLKPLKLGNLTVHKKTKILAF